MTARNAFYVHKAISQASRAHKVLEPDEEIDLVRRAQAGEPAAIERLIMAYMRMPISGAKKYQGHAETDDLIQEGTIGLLRALETFDPTKGVRFGTYARAWLKERQMACSMDARSAVGAGHSHKRRMAVYHLGRMMDAEDHAARLAGENIPRREVLARAAQRLGIPVSDAEAVLARASGDFSLNTPMQSNDDGDADEWISGLVDDAPPPEAHIDRSRSQHAMGDTIQRALAALSSRERRIVLDRHLTDAPATLEQIGLHLGISKERVRQIEAAAISKMAEALGPDRDTVLSLLGKG